MCEFNNPLRPPCRCMFSAWQVSEMSIWEMATDSGDLSFRRALERLILADTIWIQVCSLHVS